MTKLTFDASLFRAVYIASSNEKTRFYLQGVYVTKAPGAQPGVTLAATDGHMLLIGYDPNGTIEGEGVILQTEGHKVPGASFKALRKEKGRRTVQFDTEAGGVAHILNGIGETVAVSLMETIDGSFPDLYRVIPSVTGASPMQAATLDSRFVAAAAKASILHNDETRAAPISFWGDSPADPVLVTFGASDAGRDLFGVIMPLRSNSSASDGAPAWFRAPVARIAQAA